MVGGNRGQRLEITGQREGSWGWGGAQMLIGGVSAGDLTSLNRQNGRSRTNAHEALDRSVFIDHVGWLSPTVWKTVKPTQVRKAGTGATRQNLGGCAFSECRM